jgi:recombination protein RecA
MAKTKSTTKVEFDAKGRRDDLLVDLQTEINKSSKEGKQAFFLDEQDDPSTVSEWISTGSSTLDLAISNRPNGGLPVGRMVEFNGLEGTGKSLVSAHIVADTQKKGGVAVVIDTENAAAPEFWASLGVDLKNLLYIQSDTVEDVFEKMENIIAVVRKSNKKRILTIIVDSVAGVSTKAELESDHGKDGWSTGKAIIIGKAMRKITSMVGRQQVLIVFTNQLRQNLNAAMFGDKWIVSGGKALAFHCSVRVRLANAGMLKRGTMVIGNKCKAKVVKNRMGPPQRVAEFDIYHDSGIADFGSWLEVMKVHDIVKYSAPNYTYHQDVGDAVKFTAKEFVGLMRENAVLKDELYNKICNAVIMKYKDPNSNIVEDATVDENEDGVVSSDE